MRRTILILAAAGVALAAGCAKQPQQVAGEASPVGAATPVPSATPAATTSPAPSTTSAPAPTSTKPRTPSPPATTTRTSSSPPKAKVTRVIGPANVLGPTGIGKLQIGMSRAEAEATGLVVAGEGEDGCGSWYLNLEGAGDSTVGYTSRGVVSIPAFGKVATPEGIRIGSSLADAERAYSDLTGQATDKESSWGEGLATAGQSDRYAGVHYQFTFVHGSIAAMQLKHDQPKC
ncbi:hypothetical protein Ade02nite_01200 [Paractinoplanes deccanensis]|uniref:Lipoprotein n=1 Tax=Paractinoplanes deccanensis TaxID=113561 RepID=A0ABQ3XUP3_9ACTN|nr:hypothetical protein [Actinoplanes deccanensis]GID71479.1 hypothetical protein Ade02nite_01200 [Actinoplanes deccanensis]